MSKTTTQARCACLAPSEWFWDPDYREWYRSKCWRCLEIQRMKDPDNPILASLCPMDTDQTDKFVELVAKKAVLLEAPDVVRRYKP